MTHTAVSLGPTSSYWQHPISPSLASLPCGPSSPSEMPRWGLPGTAASTEGARFSFTSLLENLSTITFFFFFYHIMVPHSLQALHVGRAPRPASTRNPSSVLFPHEPTPSPENQSFPRLLHLPPNLQIPKSSALK